MTLSKQEIDKAASLFEELRDTAHDNDLEADAQLYELAFNIAREAKRLRIKLEECERGPTEIEEPSEWLTVAEVTQEFRISERWVRGRLTSGALAFAAVQFGRTWRINRPRLIALLGEPRRRGIKKPRLPSTALVRKRAAFEEGVHDRLQGKPATGPRTKGTDCQIQYLRGYYGPGWFDKAREQHLTR